MEVKNLIVNDLKKYNDLKIHYSGGGIILIEDIFVISLMKILVLYFNYSFSLDMIVIKRYT